MIKSTYQLAGKLLQLAEKDVAFSILVIEKNTLNIKVLVESVDVGEVDVNPEDNLDECYSNILKLVMVAKYELKHYKKTVYRYGDTISLNTALQKMVLKVTA